MSRPAHIGQGDVDGEHPERERVNEAHDGARLGGRIAPVHLDLCLPASVADHASDPVRLAESDAPEEHVLGSQRNLFPVGAGVGSLEVEDPVVGELARHLAAIAAQEVALVAPLDHVGVGLHSLEVGLAVQVGRHDLALALDMAGLEEHQVGRDGLAVADLDHVSDLQLLPRHVLGRVVVLPVGGDEVGDCGVLLVVAPVPREVLVDLLDGRHCEDAHKGGGGGGLAVRDGDGADGLEAADHEEVAVGHS